MTYAADEIANANLLYTATIDTAKMDPKVSSIPAAVRTALQSGGPVRVTFVDGAPQPM